MIILTLAGLVVVAATLADLAMTTLTSRGAGFITLRATEGLWRLLLRRHRRRAAHRLLGQGGPLMVGVMALVWVSLLWAGWSLVFMGGAGRIIDTSSGEAADAVASIYYAGFTLFTLGLGDYRPIGDVWQILTVLCTGNGLLGLTLAVTYLVPVISAATEKRQMALLVSSIGRTPEEILENSWDGRRFALDGPLDDLVPMVIGQGQQHLAYPALHYFHNPDAAASLSLRLAAMSEAVLLLEERVAPEHRPTDLVLRRYRVALESFLAALDNMHIEPTGEVPPLPDAGGLRRLGLPVAEDAPDEGCRLRAERGRLLALVENDGWAWSDIGGTERT